MVEVNELNETPQEHFLRKEWRNSHRGRSSGFFGIGYKQIFHICSGWRTDYSGVTWSRSTESDETSQKHSPGHQGRVLRCNEQAHVHWIFIHIDLVRLVLDTVCENLPLATVVLAGFVEHTAPKAEKLLNDEKSIINIISKENNTTKCYDRKRHGQTGSMIFLRASTAGGCFAK